MIGCLSHTTIMRTLKTKCSWWSCEKNMSTKTKWRAVHFQTNMNLNTRMKILLFWEWSLRALDLDSVLLLNTQDKKKEWKLSYEWFQLPINNIDGEQIGRSMLFLSLTVACSMWRIEFKYHDPLLLNVLTLLSSNWQSPKGCWIFSELTRTLLCFSKCRKKDADTYHWTMPTLDETRGHLTYII